MSTTDDDVAGFTVSEPDGSTSVTEAGDTDTFTVVLNAQPDSDVVLSITSSDTGEATANSPLTFTSANWDTAQVVTVTGVDDDLIDGTISSNLLIAIVDASSDDDFDAVADQTVSVSTTDDDVAGFTVSEPDGSTTVTEAGDTDTFTVVLNAQPSSNVVLSISSSDTGEATVTSSLTFTSANWDTAQVVTVTGVDDDLIDGTITSTTTISVDDANSDDNFDAVADQTVSVSTTDDDVAGFTVSEPDGSTTVTEAGDTDTFTVVLDAQPSSNVVLSISSSDTGEATVTSTVTFTSANWDTAQVVTVTGVDDDLVEELSLRQSLCLLLMQLQTIILMLLLTRPFPCRRLMMMLPGSRFLNLMGPQQLLKPVIPTPSLLCLMLNQIAMSFSRSHPLILVKQP